MGRITQNIPVTTVMLAEGRADTDTRAGTILGEEPLTLRVDGVEELATMRTPGNDIELIHGFLFGQGMIHEASQVTEARYCAGAVTPTSRNSYNVIDVHVAGRPADAPEPTQLPLAHDSVSTALVCGTGGSSSLDRLLALVPRRSQETPALDPDVIAGLPDALMAATAKAASRAGGLPIVGAFGLDGAPLLTREDIDERNAADKVIGALLLDAHLPAADLILATTGRAVFDLVRRAAMAGFAGVVTTQGATSAAVELAKEAGLALAGAVRGDRFSLYAGRLSPRLRGR